MRMKAFAAGAWGAAVVGTGAVANAQEATTATPATTQPNNFAIYGGIGSAKNADVPWSIGAYLRAPNDFLFGIDIAGEGESYDSTYGNGGSLGQGWSANAIAGRNLLNANGFQIDAALLVGVRETALSCPDGQSFLGYQCYADADPVGDYAFNYGAIATISFQSVMVGVRATGESTQATFGLRF